MKRRFFPVGYIVVAALYATPVLAMAAWALGHRSLRSVVALLVAALLVAMVLAAVTRRWRWFYVVQCPFVPLSLAFVAYSYVYRMPPGNTLAQIVAGMSLEEARGFLRISEWAWCFGVLVLWSVVFLVLSWRLPDEDIFVGRWRQWTRGLAVVLVLASGYVATNAIDLIDGIALEPSVGSLFFLLGDLPRVEAELRGSRIVKIPYHASRSGGEEVHILVVGESVRRESWSLYGYGRETNPLLSKLRNELIVLRDSVADANLTQWSVPIMLTGIPPTAFSAAAITGNLVDLASEAGFSTAWLINQDINISTSVGIRADRLVYPPDLQININGRHALDEVLLPAFGEEIRRGGRPRFIGIHMMGSHWEYYRRYSKAFQKFGAPGEEGGLTMVSLFVSNGKSDQAVVDAYDNATLYTDWFLDQLIEQARTLKVPATLTFFPDHGEDLQLLDGEAGHGQPIYTRHAFEIPAFVWLNQAYRDAHPDTVMALEANADKEIRTHDVFYAMADLMGITWPGAAPDKSFASAKFQPEAAMPHVAGGVLVSRH